MVKYPFTVLQASLTLNTEGYGSCFVVRSIHRATESSAHFFASVKNMNRLSTSMACNLTGGFAKMLSFSSYGWLMYRTSVRNTREKMHNFPRQNSRKLCDTI